MEDNTGIRIKFELTDEDGDNYIAESKVPIFYDFGETVLSVIGRQLNAFLIQCGYFMQHTEMLMKSLTEDEVELLENFLETIREGKEDTTEGDKDS